MKTKPLLLFCLIALASFAPHALAQFVPLAPIPGLTDISPTSTIDPNTLATFFNNLYKYLIGLAATLAVIEIIWGGLEISTKDSVSKQSDGKERITQAIFGLVLVLSPVLVFSIINPSILNLSLNLPPIDLTVTQSPSSTPDTTVAEAAGCSASLTSTTVGCPTQQAANDFAAACPNGSGRVYSSNDASLPYSASCDVTFQGSRNYTDATSIPSGYWCYTAKVIANGASTLTYVCGANTNSCEALSISNSFGGTVAADCSPYPH